jgi:CrcB protein
MIRQISLVAAGGALGALARFGLSTLVLAHASTVFPWGTLFVNWSGSFCIGVIAALFDLALIPPEWRGFITIGFLGAYTTFSTYSLETVNLLRDGEWRLATVYVVGSNVVGIGLVLLGFAAAHAAAKLLS